MSRTRNDFYQPDTTRVALGATTIASRSLFYDHTGASSLLRGWGGNGGTAHLAYEDNSPLVLSVSLGGVERTMQYDGLRRLSNTVVAGVDSHYYTFDTLGRRNRLKRVESQAEAPEGSRRKLEFTYDGRGRRVGRVTSVWTNRAYVVTDNRRFVYDGWKLVAELNATNNAAIRTYTWAQGELVELSQGGKTYAPVLDGNGNVTALVETGTGLIAAQYEYGPYGMLLKASGPVGLENPIRFSSEYQDDVTGFLYYGYRYFNPATQTWLSRDPIGLEGGFNLYGFAGNDPVNGRDHLGLWLELYIDSQSGSFVIADNYDVYYLGEERAIGAGETVSGPFWWTGAPLEHAQLGMLGDRSLEMVFGPGFAGAVGAGSRCLPVAVGTVGLGVQGTLGLGLLLAPEPALTKAGGAMVCGDAIDKLQAMVREDSQTGFEQTGVNP